MKLRATFLYNLDPFYSATVVAEIQTQFCVPEKTERTEHGFTAEFHTLSQDVI